MLLINGLIESTINSEPLSVLINLSQINLKISTLSYKIHNTNALSPPLVVYLRLIPFSISLFTIDISRESSELSSSPSSLYVFKFSPSLYIFSSFFLYLIKLNNTLVLFSILTSILLYLSNNLSNNSKLIWL